MNSEKLKDIPKYDSSFFRDVAPTKLTKGRKVKLHTKGWGIISDYFLESVKINKVKTGELYSKATLKISDRSGQVVCLVSGPSVGLLFGMSSEDWEEVENLCKNRDQLFYRYFKDGLSPNFGFEQRLFYNFCLNNQKGDLLVAVFQRGVNLRKKDASDPFLDILEVRKCDESTLDLYISHLRNSDVC